MLRLSARIRGLSSGLVPFLVTVAAGVLGTSRADAHFRLTAPACWLSQDNNGGPQKNGPCAAVPNTGLGDPQGTPTNIVSNFQPGQMVTVSVTATIPHPGWWRIALAEGPSASQSLTTIPDPAQTQGVCTPAIMTNPVWSPTQPVLADGLPAGSTANTNQSGSQTFQVRIPANASCTAARPCTLQVIMVMTDHPANDCYYHHCADVAALGDAGSAPGGGNDAGARDASGGTGGSTGTGGSPGAGGSAAGTGGAPGTGGATGSGGVSGAGGASTGSGGAGTGGASAGTGGATTGTGGASSTGGSTGTSGSVATGGAAGDSNGANAPMDNGGGCALTAAPRTSGMAAAFGGLLLVARLARRRRRAR